MPSATWSPKSRSRPDPLPGGAMAVLHATPGPAGPEPEVVELQPPKAPTSSLQGNEGFLWILAAGVMLFIGILKGINLVIVLGYVLAGLWVINLWLARRALRGLSARRLPRPPLTAGIAAEWPLEVQIGR